MCVVLPRQSLHSLSIQAPRKLSQECSVSDASLDHKFSSKTKTLSTTGRLDSKGTSLQEPCSHDHHPPPIRLCSQDNLVRTESATFTGPPAASPHLERVESSTVKPGGWHSQHPTGQPFRDPREPQCPPTEPGPKEGGKETSTQPSPELFPTRQGEERQDVDITKATKQESDHLFKILTRGLGI